LEQFYEKNDVDKRVIGSDLFSAQHCRPAPWVKNAKANLNQTSRTVNITCFIGYRFPDGDTSKVFYCYPDGHWDYNIPTCDGVCMYLFKWRLHNNFCLLVNSTNSLQNSKICREFRLVYSVQFLGCIDCTTCKDYGTVTDVRGVCLSVCLSRRLN